MSQPRRTLTRHVAPFAPLALALLMSRAVLPPQEGKVQETEATTQLAAVPCDEVLDFQDCHSRYPTGCSKSGGYDAYLNLLKNQLIPPPATLAGVNFLTSEDFKHLDKSTPASLGRSNHLQLKDDLAKLGEGSMSGVIGYLYYAKKTGPESSNCQLDSTDKEGTNVDYHIGIGFDPSLAQSLRTHQHLSRDALKAVTQTSVIVEMTPHYRYLYGGDNWTIDGLQNVVGRQVRVVGQLIIDSEHNIPSQNCAIATAAQQKLTCWRASAWELHPVTRFQVCKQDSCSQDSPDWLELEAAGQAAPQ